MMREPNIENLVGALALALADDLLQTAQSHITTSAPAAAVALVGHVPGLTIDQFSRVLGLSHPGAVRLVDRLVGDNLLHRGRSTHDGRAASLTLTATGDALCGRILSSRQTALARALAHLSPEDRQTFGRLAETMLRGMLRGEAHALEVCRLCDLSVCQACPVGAELAARETVPPELP